MKTAMLARSNELDENSIMTAEELTPLYNPEDDSLEAKMIAWQDAGDLARDMIAEGIEYHPTLLKKVVTRATDPYRLKKSFRPDDASDYEDFARSLEQRFIKEMDGFEPGSREGSTMLAELVSYTDGVRGVDSALVEATYKEFVPLLREKGGRIGWLAAVNRTCLFIREDKGIEIAKEEPAHQNIRPQDEILKKAQKNPNFQPTSSQEKLMLTLAQADDIGKLSSRECKVLGMRLGFEKTEAGHSEPDRERTLQAIGEKVRERHNELAHRRYLQNPTRYTGLLGVFTGNAEKKPVELIDIICRKDIHDDASRKGMGTLSYIYEVLNSDLHWLTDTTLARKIDPSSPDGHKMNGLA